MVLVFLTLVILVSHKARRRLPESASTPVCRRRSGYWTKVGTFSCVVRIRIAAAKKVKDSIEETLTFMEFPSQHWTRIRTNNTLERLNREIKRRTKPIGAFPDGNSALMLVCARLRHVAGSDWGIKRYMNMDHLLEMDADLNDQQSN